jgi:ammonia channel protein AmtB
MLGAASGAVAGLVAITPACGFVGPVGALVIGAVKGCFLQKSKKDAIDNAVRQYNSGN